MLPKHTRKEAIHLGVSLALVIGLFLFFRHVPVAPPASGAPRPNPLPEAAGSNRKRNPSRPVLPSTRSSPVPSEATTSGPALSFSPLTDHSLSVWDNGGALTQELIERYELNHGQISQLKELKAECAQWMLAIDQANASVSASPDHLSLSITINPDVVAAKAFTEFYQERLQQILGPEIYTDLAKYYLAPYMDETLNAGLVDKQIDVQKTVSAQHEVLYHIKAESKMRVSPLNMLPAYGSHSIETTGPREKLSTAYPGIDRLMPRDF